MLNQRKGFTIIELLVVISIISMLASTVLTATNYARSKGRDSLRISQIRQVQIALELYYSVNGQYPDLEDYNVAQNWSDLLDTLHAGKFLAQAQKIEEQTRPPMSFSDKLLAWLDLAPPAYALNTTIQDPQYPNQSYGYMPSAIPSLYQNFRLRAKLENTSDPVLKSSYSGYFLTNDKTPITYPGSPDQECAPLAGYYCIGPQVNSPQSFIGFLPSKPVVYLYPEHTEKVSVTIFPKSVDVSIPPYDGGWNVIAHPDGSIINPTDGKTYPYLFWDGKSERPVVDRTKGFVVKTSEVKAFLTDALAKQGLVKNEADEFMDYWVPVMTTDKPYIYVYFMPQPDYDKLVPMNIEPKPDTLVRIYMLIKPLDAPISVTPEVFSAPARKGFTVIEWGGDRSPLQ